jgi:hypothetical protein
VRATPPDPWQRVREIRMEYHDGRRDDLLEPRRRSGFRETLVTEVVVGGRVMGNLWLRRDAHPPSGRTVGLGDILSQRTR